MKKLILKNSPGAVKITHKDALLFLGKEAIENREKRGELKTRGPWNTICGYKALAITATRTPEKYGNSCVDEYTLYGDRQLLDVRQSDYHLEGRVSLDGKKYRAFTSDVLFELPDSTLVSVAVIYAVTPKEK